MLVINSLKSKAVPLYAMVALGERRSKDGSHY
jgi:hypothetical protein